MRLLSINIPDEKRIDVALTYIYGIGPSMAQLILEQTKIPAAKKAKELTAEEVNRVQNLVEKNYRVEGDLRIFVRQNVQRLKDLKTYRGSRHAKRLPVRGQRTKTNSRTIRGNVRKTAGSRKRKVELK